MESPLLRRRESVDRWCCRGVIFVPFGILAITVVGHILGGSINGSIFNEENKHSHGIHISNSEIVESEKGVVAADDGRCSEIGASILRKGGHAVDAAVATALCLGVVCSLSSGIGGGGFMLVRSSSTLQTVAIDFRETAPLAASQDIYESNVTAKDIGPLSIAVPGEIAGLHEAWLSRMAGDDMKAREPWSSLMDKRNDGPTSTSLNTWGVMSAGNFQNKKADSRSPVSTYGLYKKDALNAPDPQVNHTGLSVARKKRVHAQFNDLQECYLQKRRQLPNQLLDQQEKDKSVIDREGYNAGLSDFQSVLTTFTRYSRLRVIAELRHGDLFHSTNIVSSIEFDRDDELFATAGVSRCIKVFDFSSVVNEPPDVHCPIVEMSTRAKLSCLSWDKQSKNIIASSDYDGIVTVWDVNRGQSVMEYEEHEKRAWSVDFSRTEPSRLVSGSDDCKVKVWCMKQEASVLDIDMKANICCVKFNPGSGNHIAVGSADHNIHYYDLRNISHPLHVFTGHKKAVSYVKFLSNSELASASTDSTLRLWDVKENLPVRTFRGHTNEKNFVGLTVNNEYIACGSETNEVFIYHKEISRPLTWHRFGSPDVADVEDGVAPYFISAVCWKSDSPTILTANSQGTIKVLVLAV